MAWPRAMLLDWLLKTDGIMYDELKEKAQDRKTWLLWNEQEAHL